MRTLYLHIGNHRTATSSVQAFLLSNWELVLKAGYLHPYRIARHVALFGALFSGKRQIAEVSADLSSRADKQDHDIHSLILSDEDVCMQRDLSVLAGFRDHFDVKVVFSLRRQDLWLESWFLQNIKWQWNKSLSHCTLAEFVARADEFHWMNYDGLLQQVETLFGKENILPYVYEKAQMPDGPVGAFCDTIGLTDREGMKPAPHVNSSYTSSVAEFVRCLPLDEAPEKHRALLERAIKMVDQSIALDRPPESSLLLDHETRLALLDQYAVGNARIAQRYFNRDALFLDAVPDADAPLAQMVLPPDSETLMQDYVAPMIRGLIKQLTDMPKKG